jgi:transposase
LEGGKAPLKKKKLPFPYPCRGEVKAYRIQLRIVISGKKGYPKFRTYQDRDFVEYKTSRWKLSEDRRYLDFTDGFKAGSFKLWGSCDLHCYQPNQVKRVRVARRHGGYYAQFLIDYQLCFHLGSTSK